MALHSMQRVASSAKDKTKASIKKVLLNCTPVSLLEATSSNIEELQARKEAKSFYKDRDDDYDSSSPRSATSDSDFSDEEGYFTANDDHLDSDDSDHEDHSDDIHNHKRDAPVAQDSSSNHDGRDSSSKSVSPPDSASEGSVGVGHENESVQYNVESVSSQVERLRTSIDKLRAALYDLESEDLFKKVDDATLLRFLIARNCVIAKAADMFIKDWRWRQSFAPDGIMPEDVITSQLESEKAFLQGIDKRGRPLLILQGSRHFAKRGGLEEFKRYCYYCIEKVIACIPEGKDKFVTIIDLDGTSYKNMDIGGTKMMVNMLQAYYPERMGQLFVLHASPVIQMPYRLVEPAIDIKTRQKIMFWGSEDIDKLLLEHIGDECLPTVYGGKAEFVPIQYSKVDSTKIPSRAARSQ